MSQSAILKLVARGNDDYLIDNNIELQFFNNIFPKSNNFSSDTISFYSSGNNNWGGNINFTIEKVGDLLKNIYLVLKLPELSVSQISGQSDPITNERTSGYRVKWVDYIGNIIIENVKLKIGGQIISEYGGEYSQIYTELYDLVWSKLCLLGQNRNLITPSRNIGSQYIYIPLHFWFTENNLAHLPLISCQYQEITLDIKLRDFDKCYHVLKKLSDEAGDEILVYGHTNFTLTPQFFTNLRLDCKMIFLDSHVREELVKKKQEIVINQVQTYKSSINSNNKIRLNFNLPIKEMFFLLQSNTIKNYNELYNFSGKPKYVPVGIDNIDKDLWLNISETHLLEEASLLMNNIPIIDKKDPIYYYYLQNYEYYKNKLDSNIYMISFAVLPHEYAHTGSCNFSKIDNIELEIKLSSAEQKFIHSSDNTKVVSIGPGETNNIKVFATNYNVLVIESGISALLYSS
jgi:hypothetical protein